jgi:hypothetical protein
MTTPKFLSVQDCIEWLPESERLITLVLREIILDTLPDLTEKLSYNVPYYYGRKSLCFIWPGSVLWGKKRMYEGVRMGLTQASNMDRSFDYFGLEHRKQVGFRDFLAPEDIDEAVIRNHLLEAHRIDSKFKNSV